jgi:hypothetical protein
MRYSQTSLRVGKAGTAWKRRSSGTSATTAIVAACRNYAISGPVNVAPTASPRSSSTTSRAVPAELSRP